MPVPFLWNTLTLIGFSRIVSVHEKEGCKSRPPPLNTVELLKVASQRLGLGPSTTMHIAERLYIQGYISYPRTESTRYPASFDLTSALVEQRNSSIWGAHVAALLERGFERPKAGHDAGDHPPITPMRGVNSGMLNGDDWRIYEYIARHFIATVSPDCKFLKKKVTFDIEGEIFHCSGKKLLSEGFTAVMPWLSLREDRDSMGNLEHVKSCLIKEVSLAEDKTSPPDYLTESELISLMEKHGIGTDASIPVHINNICERNYVTVDTQRRTLIPTHLGIALVHGYHRIDPEIVLPSVRAAIEKYIDLIAKGEVTYDVVVSHCLGVFFEKFKYFVSKISLMDELFEASFSPISKTAGSKLRTKCGKCKRYMIYIPLKPTRLHCPTCEETYSLPQNGTIKLYSEITCPLDNFELVLFSLGSGQKCFPLCPYCFNYPSLDGMKKGLGCNQCTHPTCSHSVIRYGITECPECEEGVLVLDPTSGPKWKADCNLCRYQVKFLEKIYKILPTDRHCDECGTALLEFNFNKLDSPLQGENTLFTGCIRCEALLYNMIEGGFSRIKHPMFSRGRGRRRGRGRGRGRRGRSRGSY